jgi:hypothetical protein
MGHVVMNEPFRRKRERWGAMQAPEGAAAMVAALEPFIPAYNLWGWSEPIEHGPEWKPPRVFPVLVPDAKQIDEVEGE